MTAKIVEEFVAAMAQDGCGPRNLADIVPDNKRRYISAAEDKGKKKTLAYQLKIDGDCGVGWFLSFKNGQTVKFVSKSPKKLTPEEKKKWAEKIKAAQATQKEKEKAREARQARMAKRLQRAVNNMPKVKLHTYLQKKKVQAHGVRLRRDELIVPVYQMDGLPWSVQRIQPDGSKWFLSGGRVSGGYYPIPAKDGSKDTLIIGEGYATCATIHEATGAAVICAFNAGNLREVAVNMRAKYPDARIILAADNDRFTKAGNVGILKAEQAALEVGGFVIYPEFPDDSESGSDWNDYVIAHGDEQLRDKMQKATVPPVLAPEAGVGDGMESCDVVSQSAVVSFPDYEPSPEVECGQELPQSMRGDFGMQFRVLGYNDGLYFYFPFHARQIIALTAPAHTMANLLQLDSLEAWENRHGGEKVGHTKIAMYAANAMIQLSQTRGVFQEEDRVRGCGAWVDDGRKILHCGDMLYVDGEKTPFQDLDSQYTYVAAGRLLTPANKALSNAEAHNLRKICELVTWENPLSGALLAGWLVIAPICAALHYRPHIYLTGEAESGKSTVLNEIIKPVLGKIAMNVDGGTTEPAIRDMMKYDGRPLVYDEAEPSPSMLQVLELARKATTGSTVKKYGQRAFKARFCACFSAIVPPVNKTADESRISFLVIKKNRSTTAMRDYDAMLDLIEQTITPEYSNRMMARTLENMDTLMANIKTFQRAARIITGGARASQQIGTMIAGLYLLGSKGKVTREDAEEWVKKHDWSDHTIVDQPGDPIKLVQHIASSLIWHNMKEQSVGDLINNVMVDRDTASDKILRNYGVLVDQESGRVHIASSSHNLARLLKDTEWQIKWSRTLSDVAGAQKEKSTYFARGVKTNAVSLPIGLFMDELPNRFIADYVPDEQELEF